MRIPDTRSRRPSENLVPMINVVFLLLIFFLMTAQIAPPEPFDVTPPEAAGAADAQGELNLYLGPEGRLGFRGEEDEAAVLAALKAARSEACGGECSGDAPKLMLRADHGVEAAKLAALMPKLGQLGFTGIELITVRP